jgi:hypothetical protein
VVVDGGGNVVVAGYDRDFPGVEVWRVRRYDPTLTTLLGSTDYDGPAHGGAVAQALARNTNGNLVVAGYEVGTGGNVAWAVREYDPTLSTLLSATDYASPLGGALATGVAVDAGGDLVVTGSESVPLSSHSVWRVRRYSPWAAALTASVSLSENPTTVGRTFSVFLTVRDTGCVPAAGIIPAMAEHSLGGSALALGGPAPASTAYLGPGQSFTFTWTFSATAAGHVAFSASASGFDEGLSGTVLVGSSATVFIQATAPAASSTPSTTTGDDRLLLSSPGAALEKNVVRPGHGEVVLVRIFPLTGDPVGVRIFSASGRLVRTLPAHVPAGHGQLLVTWDGRTEDEQAVARGVYLVEVTGGGLSRTVLKVVII